MTRAAPKASAPLSSINAAHVANFTQRRKYLLAISLLALISSSSLILRAQNSQPATAIATAPLQWAQQPGVKQYRLQIASDDQFRDVRFDGLINGTNYEVKDLPPGLYYFRVAPAGSDRDGFVGPVRFAVKLEPSLRPPIGAAQNEALRGWSASTGEVVRLMSAQLRRDFSQDFLGVSAEGTVYAVDGARGLVLWTAQLASSSDERVRVHYDLFTPLLLDAPQGPRVVVAFDKGLRLLDGTTGKEIWKTQIAGRAAWGVAVAPPAVKQTEIYLIGEKREKLFVLDGATGQLKSQMVLRGSALGPPVLIGNSDQQQILVPLKRGVLEFRDAGGAYVRSVKLHAEITSVPLMVTTPRGAVTLVGTKDGLITLDSATFQPAGRIALDKDDYPIGTFATSDLNNDDHPEVVLTTHSGRIIAVDVSEGKIIWSTATGYEASGASFADLNGDGHPDVVLPGKQDFAIALSGIDGSVIWQSGAGLNSNAGRVRPTLAVALATDGQLIVVGNDRSATGLRALKVTKMPLANPQ